MTTSLLDHYKRWAAPPQAAESAAAAHGLSLTSPVAARWEVLQDFLDGYCRDFTPAGVLLVASDPTAADSVDTGIPLVDGEHARRLLALPCKDPARDSTLAARFWHIVSDVRRAMGDPPLESLFSNVHPVHAFPYVAQKAGVRVAPEEVAPHVPIAHPALARVAREHLGHLIAVTRPQVIACVDRLAFEAAAACAENAPALAVALASKGWERFVAERAYVPGFREHPVADYDGFRARLVPLDLHDPALLPHAKDTLAGLLSDAWT